ncbi:hypothetical protein [Desulfosporosinus meridiei]|uniref:hypothetical protein n=1 Tax=Desulfosporosinus meridiei TaxID=79209 RepID=UPI0005A8A6ED|nr:hypothetical protein [Desulfosporosinus meridiei]
MESEVYWPCSEAMIVNIIDIELAYAPPFTIAIEVLIHAATTLKNIGLGFAKRTSTKTVRTAFKPVKN